MKATYLLIALLTIVCAACDESEPQSMPSAEQRALDANLALWQRSNIPNYQYTFQMQCFCVPGDDTVVIVANRQVSQAFRTPSGVYLTPQELTGMYTIEGLFAKVQEAIDQRVYSLRVTYDAQYGFPNSISIDRDRNIADEEVTYTARDFQ
jgi:hypothetical protein